MLGCLGYGVLAVLIGVGLVFLLRILARPIASGAKCLEVVLDNVEFQFDRTYGGLMDHVPGLKGHAAFAMLSFLALLTFLVLGPNLLWKPGETMNWQVLWASWFLGLCPVAWYVKKLAALGAAGIRWMSGIFIPAMIIAYFSGASWCFISILALTGPALYVVGTLRFGDAIAQVFSVLSKAALVFLLCGGLVFLGLADFEIPLNSPIVSLPRIRLPNFSELELASLTNPNPNAVRLMALVITIAVWLGWANEYHRFSSRKWLTLGPVAFYLIVLWSLPLLCAMPWKLTAHTICAAIATLGCLERPIFDENTTPIAVGADGGSNPWFPFPAHLATGFAFVLGLLAFFSVVLSNFVFRRSFAAFREQFHFEKQIGQLDLLEREEDVAITAGALSHSFFSVPWNTPIHALFVPAVLILRLHHLSTWPDILLFFAVTFLWWLWLALADVHPRFGRFREVVDRFWFQGGQFVLSLTLILLGGLQLAGVHYVTVVVEAGGWWVARTFAFLYFALWFYEYWVNRSLTVLVWQLLKSDETPAEPKMFVKAARSERGDMQRIYSLAMRHPQDVVSDTDASPDLRQVQEREQVELAIQVHGAAKIAVISRGNLPPGFRRRRTFERIELFETLVKKARELGIFPNATLDAAENAVRDISQRINGYFGYMNFLLLTAVVMFLVVAWSMPGRPVLVANENAATPNRAAADPKNSSENDAADASDGLLELRELMFEKSAQRTDPPKRIILVAASGGGTRAALYTASVLDGLSQLDALDDVYLTSGVSGGGAALAYFAMHRDRLSGPASQRNTKEWEQFHEQMAAPFIQEVLEDWWELRMATGTALGQLLVESFDRHFKSPDSEHNTLAWCADPKSGTHKLAVIWNTTMAGEFPARYPHQKAANPQEVANWGQRFHAQLASSYHAGGRLVLTNLRPAVPGGPADAFDLGAVALPEAPREHLRFVVARDPKIPFTSAAALAANFPPVFPNAAVDLKDTQRRFWVTDGGLMDNRGILSLLLCLKQALSEESVKRQLKPPKPITLPEIHVIVIEGSAVSIDYTHDRGAKSNSGAKALIANQLMLQFRDNVNAAYSELATQSSVETQGIQFHYLTMPSVLRARGGLGTHWMLPNEVKLTPTEPVDATCAQSQAKTLSKADMQGLIRWLHPVTSETPSPSTKDSNLAEVKKWILNDSLCEHTKAWKNLSQALRRKQ